jgi:hypothetical protein
MLGKVASAEAEVWIELLQFATKSEEIALDKRTDR